MMAGIEWALDLSFTKLYYNESFFRFYFAKGRIEVIYSITTEQWTNSVDKWGKAIARKIGCVVLSVYNATDIALIFIPGTRGVGVEKNKCLTIYLVLLPANKHSRQNITRWGYCLF
ncbi:hypothetical protein MEC_00812 [Bartonella alsatica IBS 382]|uniref:Uncharacterized protein n=1 Tax=Bartonella alsatica IBS 382 TaxID=1094551 RepID=J0PS41_9HYPH|nr:hypothetical protein MEC_00812 [Bartonella alsatica IBS 382]